MWITAWAVHCQGEHTLTRVHAYPHTYSLFALSTEGVALYSELTDLVCCCLSSSWQMEKTTFAILSLLSDPFARILLKFERKVNSDYKSVRLQHPLYRSVPVVITDAAKHHKSDLPSDWMINKHSCSHVKEVFKTRWKNIVMPGSCQKVVSQQSWLAVNLLGYK